MFQKNLPVKRKEFIKKASSVLAAGPLALMACQKIGEDVSATSSPIPPSSSGTSSAACAITDAEEVGPFPLYSKRDTSIQHVDITEGKTGIPLAIALQINQVNKNCTALPDVQVVIWHCDKDGYYSGYTNSGYLGNQDNTTKTFCRGMGTTDAQGIVRFKTIYPGWDQGRATHIHAQIYVGGNLKLSTQFAFPEEINAWVHDSVLYKPHGQNPTKNTNDNVFRDSIAREMANLSPNVTTGGYDLSYSINVSI